MFNSGTTGLFKIAPNANGFQATIDTSNLTADHTYTFSDSGGGIVTSAASPNTSIQFNNGGNFGGTQILYTEPSSNAQLKIKDQTVTDNSGSALFIYGADGKGTGSGGYIDIFAGSGEGHSFKGSELYLGSSQPTGQPSGISLLGAYGIDGDGGDVYIQAGGKGGGGVNNGNLVLGDPDAFGAIIDTSLTTAYRTFTFPDASGVVALQSAASGSFTTVDLKTVTVVNGIITSII